MRGELEAMKRDLATRGPGGGGHHREGSYGFFQTKDLARELEQFGGKGIFRECSDTVKDLNFFRVGGGSFQKLSDNIKTFIETDTESFLRPRLDRCWLNIVIDVMLPIRTTSRGD